MPEILFLNPHKRGTKGRKAKRRKSKRRTAAPKLFANPVKRRRKRRAGRVRTFAVRARRNPLPMPKNLISGMVIPAAQGAAGAIALSAANGMLIDKLPLPANMKAGVLRDVLKGVTAVGIGMLASKVAASNAAKNIAVGAMTMVITDAARRALIRFAPGVNLAGLEEELMGLSYETDYSAGIQGDDPLALDYATDPGMEGDDPLAGLGFHTDPALAGDDPLVG